jgi:hypothetical protein
VRCPKERTLVTCSEGKEVELFDFIAQLIIERIEDGTLRKADALRLLDRIERLYFKVHEYTTAEDNWLY